MKFVSPTACLTGDYALVLPVAGKDRSSADRSAPASRRVERRSTVSASKARREAPSSSSLMTTGRCAACWSSAPAAGRPPQDAAEKLGGTAVARLLTSGETDAPSSISPGSATMPTRRLGSALGAALRSWRYDRYRTKLKDKQKPTLGKSSSSAAARAPGKRWEQRWAPVYEGV